MTLADKLREHGIVLRREGNQKLTCPECSHLRRNKRDPCLSVTVSSDRALWHCHNCGWSGAVYEDNAHEAFRNRGRVRKGERHQRVDLGTARRRLRYGIDAT